jgi:hypothetical protein
MLEAVWLNYRPGQERRKDPTPAYLDAAAECVQFIDWREAST